jgi:hypothetical protein
MRASDHDRQEVVDRLRDAVGDGRLKMDEYVERMELAYQAVTHGDLAPLHADLAAGSRAERRPVPPARSPSACIAWRDAFAGLPGVLKVLWTIWLTAVSINIVTWALVSGTTGHLIYPWPGLGRRSVRGRAVRRVGCRYAVSARDALAAIRRTPGRRSAQARRRLVNRPSLFQMESRFCPRGDAWAS